MNEYLAFAAYVIVTLLVFIGGLLWIKYRQALKRRFHIQEYRDAPPETHPDEDKQTPELTSHRA